MATHRILHKQPCERRFALLEPSCPEHVLARHDKREHIRGAGVLGDEPKVVLAESGDAASLQLRRGGGRSGGAGP